MLTIQENLAQGPKAVATEFKARLKDELDALGRRWHRDILPHHFEVSAGQRYGYQPRTRAYMIRKAKVKHHQKPLVWSGRTETGMRQQARISVVKSTVKVTMTAAKFLNIRRNATAPDLAAEATANNPVELGEMQQRFALRMTEHLKLIRYAHANT